MHKVLVQSGTTYMGTTELPLPRLLLCPPATIPKSGPEGFGGNPRADMRGVEGADMESYNFGSLVRWHS